MEEQPTINKKSGKMKRVIEGSNEPQERVEEKREEIPEEQSEGCMKKNDEADGGDDQNGAMDKKESS